MCHAVNHEQQAACNDMHLDHLAAATNDDAVDLHITTSLHSNCSLNLLPPLRSGTEYNICKQMLQHTHVVQCKQSPNVQTGHRNCKRLAMIRSVVCEVFHVSAQDMHVHACPLSRCSHCACAGFLGRNAVCPTPAEHHAALALIYRTCKQRPTHSSILHWCLADAWQDNKGMLAAEHTGNDLMLVGWLF